MFGTVFFISSKKFHQIHDAHYLRPAINDACLRVRLEFKLFLEAVWIGLSNHIKNEDIFCLIIIRKKIGYVRAIIFST